MYGWIWRKLPFGVPGKIIGSLLLVAAAVWVLWYHVFPAVEPILPFDDVQVGTPGGNDVQPTEGGAPPGEGSSGGSGEGERPGDEPTGGDPGETG